MNKRIVMGTAVALMSAVVFLACGESSGATTALTSSNATSGGTATANTSITRFKIGQQVAVGSDYVVTVNGVKTSQGDDIDQPKTGDDYLIVDVTIKNTSGQSQTISSLASFDLKDSTGQKYDEAILSNETAPDGAVANGDQLRGQLSYEVPTSQHKFSFSFQPDIISSDVVLWDVSI